MSREETDIQEICLKRLESKGLILDIGGGGEGLVSRVEGKRVIAVDIRIDEIREAQIHGAPANWFVGDGRRLSFKDNTFETVTLWFSIGYMRDWTTKKEVLTEAKRVMKKQGTLSIMASKIIGLVDQFVFWALFTLPDGTQSQTGYGVRGNQDQRLERVIDLVEQLEFKVLEYEDHGEWFSILATSS